MMSEGWKDYFYIMIYLSITRIDIMNYTSIDIVIIIKIIIYHDFLPPPRRGSHVKSANTHPHIIIKIHPLAHIVDT